MDAKPILLLVFFILFIVLLASGAIGDTDLTPDTPPAQSVSYSSGPAAAVPLELQAAPAALAPGLCGAQYTIQSGDTLSAIARRCGLELADIIAANSSIANPDLIHAGQVIALPGPRPAAVPTAVSASQKDSQPTAPLPVAPTSTPQPLPPTAAPTAAPTADPNLAVFETAAAQPPPAQPTAGVSMPVRLPGDRFDVVVNGLPPSAPVRMSAGPENEKPWLFSEGRTAADGSYRFNLAIPGDALPGQVWIVTVTTTAGPEMKSTAEPWRIGP